MDQWKGLYSRTQRDELCRIRIRAGLGRQKAARCCKAQDCHVAPLRWVTGAFHSTAPARNGCPNDRQRRGKLCELRILERKGAGASANEKSVFPRQGRADSSDFAEICGVRLKTNPRVRFHFRKLSCTGARNDVIALCTRRGPTTRRSIGLPLQQLTGDPLPSVRAFDALVQDSSALKPVTRKDSP